MSRRPSLTCPFRKSYPDVMVVQAGQDWDGDNGAGPLDCPTQRRVFAQGQVRTDLIVIRRIRRKNLPQVRFAKDQHPVQALATHGANQRSTYGFGQGGPSQVDRTRMPIALTPTVKVCP